MLIDTELEPITIELGLDEWRETLRELEDIPEIRGQILGQLLNTIGEDRRAELTDQGIPRPPSRKPVHRYKRH